MKCNKLFPNEKIEYDNNSLFWYMSEIVIDPILNSNIFKRLFKHKYSADYRGGLQWNNLCPYCHGERSEN